MTSFDERDFKTRWTASSDTCFCKANTPTRMHEQHNSTLYEAHRLNNGPPPSARTLSPMSSTVGGSNPLYLGTFGNDGSSARFASPDTRW